MTPKNLAQYASKLEKQINTIKYTLHCITVIEWIFGGFLFGLAIALRLDNALQEWIEILDIGEFYIGVYILMLIGFLLLLLPVFSCISVYREINQLLLLNNIGHFLCFFFLMIGNGFLLQNSSNNSGVQNTIRISMRNMIHGSYHDKVSDNLNMIQEEVGCCGADGPNDYLILRKPLPNECRDSVTGNGYYHGCTDEIIWFLEDKAYWLSGIAFGLGFLQVLIAVLGHILIESLKKEEKTVYRR